MNSRYRKIGRGGRRVRTERYEELQRELQGGGTQGRAEESSSSTSLPAECQDAGLGVFSPETAPAGASELPLERFVVVGLDFVSRVTAEDLFVLCSSFLPVGGRLRAVAVYQSNYGREKLRREREAGPDLQGFAGPAFYQVLGADRTALKTYKRSVSGGCSADEARRRLLDTNPAFQQLVAAQKLRLYQLDQLTWYYAVVHCDSRRTADSVFNQITGHEFESVGCVLECQELTAETWAKMQSQPLFDTPEADGGYLRGYCSEAPLGYRYMPQERVGNLTTNPQLNFDQDDKERVRFMNSLKLGQEVDERALGRYFDLGSGEESDSAARELLLAPDTNVEEAEEREEAERTPFQLSFKPTFNAPTSTQRQTPLQQRARQVTWEYREQRPVAEKPAGVSKEVQNYYKKILKGIQSEDDPKVMKMLLKRKRRLEEKYERLKEFGLEGIFAAQQGDAKKDARFDELGDLK